MIVKPYCRWILELDLDKLRIGPGSITFCGFSGKLQEKYKDLSIFFEKKETTQKRRLQLENDSSDSDDSSPGIAEPITYKPIIESKAQEKSSKKSLEFGDIDFVIEQIENLPKSRFANGEIVYQKRGKRKCIFFIISNYHTVKRGRK